MSRKSVPSAVADGSFARVKNPPATADGTDKTLSPVSLSITNRYKQRKADL